MNLQKSNRYKTGNKKNLVVFHNKQNKLTHMTILLMIQNTHPKICDRTLPTKPLVWKNGTKKKDVAYYTMFSCHFQRATVKVYNFCLCIRNSVKAVELFVCFVSSSLTVIHFTVL